MKNIKNLYIVLFSLMAITYGCQENDYSFGDIITPSNIQITAEIVGADTSNPNGDGSGVVNF
ncbi:MAG: glucan endo-1,3-beta-D-glucosidase, partial [Polaribacter sp.]